MFRQNRQNQFYRITDSSRSTYLQAEQRIYNDQMKEWDHYWDLILMSSLDTENKALLKKELEWLGFANISTNLMAYPGCNRIELQRLLVDLNMSEQVVVFKAETLQLLIIRSIPSGVCSEPTGQSMNYAKDIYSFSIF